MDERTIKAQVSEATRALGTAGQGDMVWGHLSMRDPSGRGVWMKSSGWGFEEVTPDRVVLIDEEGNLRAGSGRAHVESFIHSEIMRARADVLCVVHTHASHANIFASLGVPLPVLSHEGVPFAAPQIPRFEQTGDLVRTRKLGSELAMALGDAPACLMPRHGLVTVGGSLAEAVMHAVLLAKACELAVASITAGGPRQQSNADEIHAKRAHAWPQSQFDAGYDYLVRRANALSPSVTDKGATP